MRALALPGGPAGRRSLVRVVLRDRRARVGLIVLALVALSAIPAPRVRPIVLALVALSAIAAPLIAPYDPAAQLDIVRLQSRPPSFAHPLGTDPFSRDVLSRLMWGARISLAIAVVAVTLSVTLGILVGAIAGYAGGAVDAVLMRFVDAAL